MPDSIPIVVDGLHVRHGTREVLSGVSFRALRGRVTALWGINGAGKTTTFRALTGLVRSERGDALVWGHRYADLAEPARCVGHVGDELIAFPGHTALEHLSMVAARAGATRPGVNALLERVGLASRPRDRISTYSLGMRRRLALATAMLGDPALLLLDEPSNGLDPQGQIWLRDDLRRRADRGDAVFVSSHSLAAWEGVVDDVVILRAGVTAYCGSLSRLRRTASPRILVESDDRAALTVLLEQVGARIDGRDGAGFSVSGVSPEQIARAALSAHLLLLRLVPVIASIEETFVRLADEPGEHLEGQMR